MLADLLNAKEQAAVSSETGARTVPRPYTRFIGREVELGHVRQLLAAHRLVVLTGPGGVGKSRLAIRLAADLADDYPDGVRFVEAAAMVDARQLISRVLAAMGLAETAGQTPTNTLVDHLADKRLLLVIDNCEHLVTACSRLIGEVMKGAAEVQLLVTSRQALRVDGAVHWQVPPMALPPVRSKVSAASLIHYDAPRLFGARASVATGRFELADVNAERVAGICARLDGLPLAIELAAMQLKQLSLDQLDSDLANRFALLKDGRRATRRSHDTLRAMMDWSYELLGHSEQLLFQRLAVFRGGWTLEAAEAVCAGEGIAASDVHALLDRLAAQSLIEVRTVGDALRYAMLETVREYALLRLDHSSDGDPRRRRHVDYCLDLFGRLQASRLTASHESELDQLEIELPNCLAALDWAHRSGDAARCLEICAALTFFWYDRGLYKQGSEVVSDVLRWADASPATFAHASTRRRLAMLLTQLGDLKEARNQLLVSQVMSESLNDVGGSAATTRYLGYVSECLGELDEARANYRQALGSYELLGDDSGVMTTLASFGTINTGLGNYDTARADLRRALDLANRLGSTRATGQLAESLGNLAVIDGDHDAATQYFRQQLAAAETVRNPTNVASAQVNLAWVAMEQGDLNAARDLASAGLALSREHHALERQGDALVILGGTLSRLGDHAGAQSHFAESAAICRRLGARHHLATTLQAGVDADLRAGVVEGVSSRLRECIEIFADVQAPRQVVQNLELYSELARLLLQPVRVAVLMGAAAAARERLGTPLPPALRDDYALALDDARQRLGDVVFEELCAEGRAMTLEDAVAYATGET